MRYYSETIPLFEASNYLNARLSKKRTSDFIRTLENNEAITSDERWIFFQKITELEAELDSFIVTDDPLVRRYFTPLEMKTDRQIQIPLTLGLMLLSIPPDIKQPFDFDDLFDFYKNAPQEKVLDLLYERLYPFFTDSKDKDATMSGFVAAVNSVLIKTDDKWAVIDCASNPAEHLEALRPLVTRTMKLIVEKSKPLSGFIKGEMDAFCAKGQLERRIDFLFGSGIKTEDIAGTEIYPSIFDINGAVIGSLSEDRSIKYLIIGLYLNMLYQIRTSAGSSAEHVKLLKMLSDQTRFNILHELCDHQTYGQELADKFGGARSAIYYHLERLLSFGLLDLEMTEYRMLYTMNKEAVFEKLTALRDYLVNGWKPETTDG